MNKKHVPATEVGATTGHYPPSSAEYLGHICRELSLSGEVEKTARGLLEGHHTGGNPVGIAAAASYEAANAEEADLTLREVAEMIGLTKQTVWRHASKIRE